MSRVLRRMVLPEAGTTVSAMSSDAPRLYAMVRAISTSSWRTRPSVKMKGRNTQMVVMVLDTMEPDTCRAPCTAARAAGTPRLRRR